MSNYLIAGVIALGAGLSALKYRKDKEYNVTINDFVRKETHCEASITDGLGNTYRIYGENLNWWYKTSNDPVPNKIAKIVNEYRTEYMRKLIKANITPVGDDVVIRDGKQLKKLPKKEV